MPPVINNNAIRIEIIMIKINVEKPLGRWRVAKNNQLQKFRKKYFQINLLGFNVDTRA